MSKLIAIYSSETDLTDTLDALYAQNVESDNVTLIRENTGTDLASENAKVYPVGAGAANKASSTSPNPAAGVVAVGTIPDLSLEVEQRRFYEQQLDDGATLLIVDIDDVENDVETIKQALHKASRVDEVS